MRWDDLEAGQAAPAKVEDEEGKATSTVGATIIDMLDYQQRELGHEVQRLTEFGANLREAHGIPGEHLALDLYTSMARGALRVPAEDEMPKDCALNREAMVRFLSTDEVAELRSRTVSDPQLAHFAAVQMRDSLTKILEEILEEEGGGGGDSDGDGDEEGDSQPTPGQQAAAAAAASVMQKHDENEAVATAYGLGSSEDWEDLPFEERSAMVDSLQRKTDEIANLLGELRSLSTGRLGVMDAQAGEVVDVELGDDLTALSTEEMLNFAIPELEDLFWARWADSSLQIMKRRDLRETGRGPIILVGDESLSMDEPIGSHGARRIDWLKALAITLAITASRENRDFVYIGFSTEPGRVLHPLRSARDYVAMVHSFQRNGTYPFTALDLAVNESSRFTHGKADIVLFSDGEFGSDEGEALRRAESLGVKILGVSLGQSRGMKETASHVMRLDQLTAGGILDIGKELSDDNQPE